MKQKSKSRPIDRLLRWRYGPSILVMVAFCALLSVGMILLTAPERYNLSVGDIAPKTITATKDVVDEISTEQKRERAAENVLPTYMEDESAVFQVLSDLDGIFEEFETIRAYGEGLRTGDIPSASAEEFVYSGSFPQADLEYAQSLSSILSLSTYQATLLMRQSEKELNDLHINTRETVRKQMESTIREGQLETSISAIQRQLMPTASSDVVLIIAIPAVRACLVPNMVVDQDATEINREAARNEVEPTYFKSGQNIVVAGEGVTEAQLAVLESLGLLEGNRFDSMMMAGVTLLSILSTLALLFHILQFDRELMASLRQVLLLATIFAITILLSIATANINAYFVPVSMVVLLATTLLSPSLALTANSLALILISMMINSAETTFVQQVLYIMVSGVLCAPVGIYIASRLRQQRTSVLFAGLAMAVCNLLSMTSIGLLTNHEFKTIVENALWAAASNVLAAFLCMGAQPILEIMFNLVTPFKLVELSNPNQPLLRRLLTETPGTYHHSIMVANLAEAAAEAIGADPLLTRVGSYYHDIGKLNRPLFFKENQLGDNPHDRTDPRVSAQIICAHVSDGILLARQNRLPEAVTDFIAQHHGTTLVGYFYQKMIEMAENKDEVHAGDFQYPGPRPQTAEIAIVMLADTTEAAIRAGGDQPADVIEKRIRTLVKDKIDNWQLNESPLRFADVEKIIHAFTQVLTGIYHKRIEYPPVKSALSPGTPAPTAKTP